VGVLISGDSMMEIHYYDEGEECEKILGYRDSQTKYIRRYFEDEEAKKVIDLKQPNIEWELFMLKVDVSERNPIMAEIYCYCIDTGEVLVSESIDFLINAYKRVNWLNKIWAHDYYWVVPIFEAIP